MTEKFVDGNPELKAARAALIEKEKQSSVVNIATARKPKKEPKQLEEWATSAHLTESGTLKKNAHNAHLFFRLHPDLKNKIRLDEFRRELFVFGDLPWGGHHNAPRPWMEIDLINAHAFSHSNGLEISKDLTHDAATAIAHLNKFHPVKDYLNGLKWDGIDRLDYWLSTYCGAAHTNYTAAVGRAWLISGVARIMKPGCKADAMIILEGDQGIRKSTALRILGGEWFTDELGEIGTKDTNQQVLGAWIIEMAELNQLSRAETTRVKAFVSRTEERFRPPYGRTVETFPRECIFAGTTNADGGYFRDETGNRRYWPIRCCENRDNPKINTDGLAEIRDQLWAEATHRFRSGEKWYLVDNVETIAAEQQAERIELDPWHETVAEWCENRSDPRIAIVDVLTGCLFKKMEDITLGDDRRVGSILRKLGYKSVNARVDGQVVRRWKKLEM